MEMSMIPPRNSSAQMPQKIFSPASAVTGLWHTGQYRLIVSWGLIVGRTSLAQFEQKTMFSRPKSR